MRYKLKFIPLSRHTPVKIFNCICKTTSHSVTWGMAHGKHMTFRRWGVLALLSIHSTSQPRKGIQPNNKCHRNYISSSTERNPSIFKNWSTFPTRLRGLSFYYFFTQLIGSLTVKRKKEVRRASFFLQI